MWVTFVTLQSENCSSMPVLGKTFDSAKELCPRHVCTSFCSQVLQCYGTRHKEHASGNHTVFSLACKTGHVVPTLTCKTLITDGLTVLFQYTGRFHMQQWSKGINKFWTLKKQPTLLGNLIILDLTRWFVKI